jgi:hypothetical protein
MPPGPVFEQPAGVLLASEAHSIAFWMTLIVHLLNARGHGAMTETTPA